MSTKTKRTYNISPEAIATVKRLVEERHVATSQDAVVEMAISELERSLRDADDARRWAEALNDAEFQAEVSQLEAEFREDDRRAWEC